MPFRKAALRLRLQQLHSLLFLVPQALNVELMSPGL